ncbi:MAG: glycosyltransferase family 4 protein [Asgard group archaeon]|nr:glycosyltransferase family 4 protein [Asgard group archaeon]
MKNILMTTHNAIPDARIEKESLSLRKKGYSVYLITPSIKIDEARKSFDEVLIYNHSLKHNLFLKPAINDAIKFYSKIVEEKNIDAIHSHNLSTANIGFRVAKKYNLKFIYDDHETWSLWLKLRAKAGIGLRKIIRYYIAIRAKKLERKIAKSADLIIVTNIKCIPFYNELEIPKEKIISVENIALQNEIDEALNREDLIIDFFKNDKRKKIVHVYHGSNKSRQEKRDDLLDRDFDLFVEAQNKLDDWVLVLFGKENSDLIKKGVVFLDFMPRINYLANIAKADVGLNPLTITEKTLISSQNRVFEYAKLGLRIISTKTPLLQHNFNEVLIWVNPDDPLDKIIDILQNINKFPSGKDIQDYSKKFDWENEMQKVINAYSEFK